MIGVFLLLGKLSYLKVVVGKGIQLEKGKGS